MVERKSLVGRSGDKSCWKYSVKRGTTSNVMEVGRRSEGTIGNYRGRECLNGLQYGSTDVVFQQGGFARLCMVGRSR